VPSLRPTANTLLELQSIDVIGSLIRCANITTVDNVVKLQSSSINDITWKQKKSA
jgi:hypothetical protein